MSEKFYRPSIDTESITQRALAKAAQTIRDQVTGMVPITQRPKQSHEEVVVDHIDWGNVKCCDDGKFSLPTVNTIPMERVGKIDTINIFKEFEKRYCQGRALNFIVDGSDIKSVAFLIEPHGELLIGKGKTDIDLMKEINDGFKGLDDE